MDKLGEKTDDQKGTCDLSGEFSAKKQTQMKLHLKLKQKAKFLKQCLNE